jgi:hypothetical protein
MRIERELGLAGPDKRAALVAHLEACSACRALDENERALTAGLAALREAAPVRIDVTSRVAARVAALPADPRSRSAVRQVAAPVIALAGFGALLLVGLGRVVPGVLGLAPDAAALAAGLRLAAANLAAPALETLRSVVVALTGVPASLAPVIELLPPFRPLAIGTLAACTATMVSTTALVVYRDVQRPHRMGEEAEE